MGSVFEALEESSREGPVLIPSTMREGLLAQVEKSGESKWLMPTAGWSLLPFSGAFMGFGAAGLPTVSFIAAGVGATIFSAAAVTRKISLRRSSKARKELSWRLNAGLRQYSVVVSKNWSERLVDFCFLAVNGQSLQFVDKDKSSYLLRMDGEGDISLVLLVRSSTSAIKDTIVSSVSQVFGMKASTKPVLVENAVMKELPPAVVQEVVSIERMLNGIGEFRSQLDVEGLHGLEHAEKELLEVLRLYVRLSRLKTFEAGMEDTMMILGRLRKEVVVLRDEVSASIERDLSVQRIYFEDRDEKKGSGLTS